MTKKDFIVMMLERLGQTGFHAGEDAGFGYGLGFEDCYRLLTTPRPMSEAPRDRTVILGIPNVVITWSPAHKRWYSNGRMYKDDDFTGWLPIFTPLDEDAN